MRRTYRLITSLLACGFLAMSSRGEEPATWPASQEGLTFCFATGHFKTPVIAFDQDGKRIASSQFLARGRARYDRNYALVTSGGSFVLNGGEMYPLVACQKSGALTMEAYLTPVTSAFEGTGEIISFSSGADSRNFSLVQDKHKLVLRLRTSAGKPPGGETVELCVLPDQKPCHVAITYAKGSLFCYLNGKEVRKSTQVGGDLSNWEAAHLVFGEGWVTSQNWPGTLEGVALFSRVVSAEDVAQDAAAYMKKVVDRKPVPILKLKGKLLAKSKVPEAKEIAPYYQSLATFEYEVGPVIDGSYDGQRIRVAHWGMMEKKILPAIAERPIAQSYELQLEPMEKNRQLESQWLSDTLEPSDLPLFYDVSP